jgi:hypothetical protein
VIKPNLKEPEKDIEEKYILGREEYAFINDID